MANGQVEHGSQPQLRKRRGIHRKVRQRGVDVDRDSQLAGKRLDRRGKRLRARLKRHRPPCPRRGRQHGTDPPVQQSLLLRRQFPVMDQQRALVAVRVPRRMVEEDVFGRAIDSHAYRAGRFQQSLEPCAQWDLAQREFARNGRCCQIIGHDGLARGLADPGQDHVEREVRAENHLRPDVIIHGIE